MPILLFVSCTAISFFSVLLLRKVAIKKQIFDRPDEYLKTHSRPIPFLGGMGIVSAFYLLSIVLLIAGKISITLFIVNTFLILYSITGLWDDLKNISVFFRLTAEIVISIIIFVFGISIDISPFIILNMFITFVFIVGIINAVNMEDGMDGLAGGLLLFSSLGLLFLNYQVGNTELVLVLSIFSGSIFGFLFLNFPPAKIFMGDSGSYLLGGGIAVFSIMSVSQFNFFSILGISFILGMPVIDFIFVFSKRIINKKSPFSGDRSHLYDLVGKKGYSTINTIYMFYSTQAMLILLGLYILGVFT